mgnify:CR=1 FL=1
MELRAREIQRVVVTNTTTVYNTTEVIVEEEEIVFVKPPRKTQFGLHVLTGVIVVAILAYAVTECICRAKEKRDERAKIEGEQLAEIAVSQKEGDISMMPIKNTLHSQVNITESDRPRHTSFDYGERINTNTDYLEQTNPNNGGSLSSFGQN